MWRLVKLLGMIVLTVCFLLQAPGSALAQSSTFVLTIDQGGGGPPNTQPDGPVEFNLVGNGTWSGLIGDSVNYINIYYSSDGGETWNAVDVPAGNITNPILPSGSWYVIMSLPIGNFEYYSEITAKSGKKITSPTNYIQLPPP